MPPRLQSRGMSEEFRRNAWRGIIIVAVMAAVLILYCLLGDAPFGLRGFGLKNPALWMILFFGIVIYLGLLEFPSGRK